jgi:hypothetical protein
MHAPHSAQPHVDIDRHLAEEIDHGADMAVIDCFDKLLAQVFGSVSGGKRDDGHEARQSLIVRPQAQTKLEEVTGSRRSGPRRYSQWGRGCRPAWAG